eukprot:gnl/TRDRNA2_/TRDRNA2_166714_c0_seq1.p1 gnl/TRDRNA2_/TRDRNA2_166714_c0~~gnl/TRDRNA2_/TRDRNA2_166714_c0_seq1.p1  ORF type:complete len:328 (-),score=59.19 gnl/TRDRNA2_/TRDRNA2_166714_c0_seq1:66-1049(-)
MGAAEGKPSYSIAGLIFGQLMCAKKYTRHLCFSPVEADLTGKTFVVTGGSSGIGLACVKELLRLHAKQVHFSCRDMTRGEAVAAELRSEAPAGSCVSAHKVDVGLVEEVQRFAEQLEGPIHGIVNNAGALINRRELNSDSIESHVAAHVIGLHATTRALLPKLAQEAYVVNVASAGLYGVRLDVTAIENGFKDVAKEDGSLDGALAYAVCKRAQLELTKKWASTLSPKQHVYSMHPGWCKTAGLDGLFEAHPAYKVGFDGWRSAAEGADTIVWLMAGQAPTNTEGSFFFDREQAKEHQWFAGTRSTPEDVNRLWSFCEAKAARPQSG